MMIVGGVFVALPVVDRMVGEWRQQELAATSDAAIPRYRNAVSAAYGALNNDLEDALVSWKVGALPTAADGSVIGLPDDREPADHEARPPISQAVIRIPKIGLNQAVVDGVSGSHLKQGPGHYPGTAIPGYTGNSVISGHRTTYTKPFYDLDLLGAGDPIIVDTPDGSYRYIVESAHVVAPDDASLLAATDRAVLTLTTCTPKGTALSRLVVVAVLEGVSLDATPP